MFNTIYMRKESAYNKSKCPFNSSIIFLIGMMGLVDIEITNIRLQVWKFEPQITTFYIQSASLFSK